MGEALIHGDEEKKLQRKRLDRSLDQPSLFELVPDS